MKGNSKNNTKIKVKVGLVCINAAKAKAKEKNRIWSQGKDKKNERGWVFGVDFAKPVH